MVIGTDFIGSCKSNTIGSRPRQPLGGLRVKIKRGYGLRLGKGGRVKDEEKREGLRVGKRGKQ